MDDTSALLLRMKGGAVRATGEGDVEYYDGYLSDDALAVLPAGTLDKSAVLAQVARPDPAFRATGGVEDERVVMFSPDCGVVFYTALYPGGRVIVSTVFLRRDGQWRAVLYQQTPQSPP